MEGHCIAVKVGIIGGGIAGLTAAYELSKRGVKVTIFEREDRLGGLASSFQIEGRYLERYYHFICRGDHCLMEFLQELGLDQHLNWVHTTMGLFHQRKLYPFGEPWDLITFPVFNWWDKVKFGWGILSSKSGRDWRQIEEVPAAQWLVQRFGRKAYEVVHEPLIRRKFGPYAERLSAAWMWARIHRVGQSRTRILQREMLGYIDGGTQRLIDRLEEQIAARGAQILKKSPVTRILLADERVKGLICDGRTWEFDHVISTVATPHLAKLTQDLCNPYFQKVNSVDSIGVVCLLLRLRGPLSNHFWVNISDPRLPLLGVIEFTNLNPCSYLGRDTIVYLPQYLPSTDDRYSMPDDDISRECLDYLKLVFPHFAEEQVKEYRVFRDRYAQPICELGFARHMPEIKSPIDGLYVTDSCQLHPDDRTVSGSIALAQSVAVLVIHDLQATNL